MSAAPPGGGVGASGPRRTAVWVGPEGLDEATAVRLHMVGVDELVVWRGRIGLSGGAPVVRLEPWPDVAGPLRVTAALTVEAGNAELGPQDARLVWSTLATDVVEGGASALVLDVPKLPAGFAEFIAALTAEAGLPVVPLLSVEQLQTADGLAVARTAQTCIVPLFGFPGALLRDTDQQQTAPLAERLAPLAGSGVRVRTAIALRPVIEPAVNGWGADLNLLTEDGRCEVSTSSRFDRSFTFKAALEWSGRAWKAGDTVAIGWFDAARLNAAIAETTHLVLPELAGWDLVPVPPPEAALGVDLAALEGYLAGEGPQPTLEVEVTGRGATRNLVVRNTGPFTSAISATGSWFELVVDGGRLVAEERGGFDKVAIGTIRGAEFRLEHVGAADAVRFYETYVGPDEEIESGPIRLSSSRATVRVRWDVVLSTGEHVTGTSSE